MTGPRYAQQVWCPHCVALISAYELIRFSAGMLPCSCCGKTTEPMDQGQYVAALVRPILLSVAQLRRWSGEG